MLLSLLRHKVNRLKCASGECEQVYGDKHEKEDSQICPDASTCSFKAKGHVHDGTVQSNNEEHEDKYGLAYVEPMLKDRASR